MGGLKYVPEWVKGCDTGSCVEVWQGKNSVMVRNSDLPQQITVFEPSEWRDFLAAVKAGRFDQGEPVRAPYEMKIFDPGV